MTSAHLPRIVVVGDIVTDILAVYSGLMAVGSDTEANIRMTGGGSAANTAAWLAWLNHPVALVGVVGTDPAGDARLAELGAAGVDRTTVRRTPDAPTGSVIVLAHPAERSMLCDRGANLHLSASDVDAALATTAGHLHVSGYTLLDNGSRAAGRHALATARARGLTTSVDAASAAPLRRVTAAAFLDWVDGTDVLFANLDEALALAGVTPGPAQPYGETGRPYGETGQADAGPNVADAGPDVAALARSLARFARYAVVKLGPDGAVCADSHGRVIRIPAVAVTTVVDPTGAGDAFAAGFLTAWLSGADLTGALHAAARAGALAVSRHGGRPAAPPDSPAGA